VGERVHDLRELVASRSGALLRTALGGPSDRAHRRRRALTTTAVPLLVLVALAAAATVFGAPWRSGGAAGPGDGGRPGAGSSSGSAMRAAVRDGRFVRPVS